MGIVLEAPKIHGSYDLSDYIYLTDERRVGGVRQEPIINPNYAYTLEKLVQARTDRVYGVLKRKQRIGVILSLQHVLGFTHVWKHFKKLKGRNSIAFTDAEKEDASIAVVRLLFLIPTHVKSSGITENALVFHRKVSDNDFHQNVSILNQEDPVLFESYLLPEAKLWFLLRS